ncbi:MAG: Uma2 family endonuclease [Planctomycetes bacterium]|nr:Uma2 family endonuclease [Planctomycetota bacterium]
MIEVKNGARSIDFPYTVRMHGITEKQFDEIVDEDTSAELLDGVMYVHSPASLEHDDLGNFLRTLFRLFARRRKLGKVYGPDSLVRLKTGRKLAPDGYFVAKSRLPRTKQKVFHGSPDLVLEILSPSNRDFDLEDKRPAYHQAGVSEIWIVDPENQEVIVDYKIGRRYDTVEEASGKITSRALPRFWLRAEWLWEYDLPDEWECLNLILGEKHERS